MELKNLCVFFFAFALVMIVNLRIFHFLRPTEDLLIFVSSFFFRHSGNIFLSLQARKLKAKSKASWRFNNEINLLIFVVFCCGPDTREKRNQVGKALKANSWKRNEFQQFVSFIMMALDAASLNPFLMSQTTDDHFSVRDFSWANEGKKKSTNTKMGRNNNTKFYV